MSASVPAIIDPASINRFPGPPVDPAAGPFIIAHARHGIMIARWHPAGECFYAVGPTGLAHSPVLIVAIADDQIDQCLWHASLAALALPFADAKAEPLQPFA